ncbi:DUF4168 domain-containing protein [Marinimicrobium sp. ARAG 43.8]|uniref:DUF4168 domain-containing protein n=1 Tax=Marinimicrobium sp. ARAG 43.8 TaxID=3418719 RepID=UPI003CF03B27
MRKNHNPVLALIAGSVLMFGAGAVSAQSTPQGQPQQPAAPQTEAAQMDVSEEQVESFVDAYMAVQGINQEYTQKLQAVEDPEEATELQQEAQTEMQEAVSNSGLSISEYQQIANQAGQDEELRNQIESALTERIESQDS